MLPKMVKKENVEPGSRDYVWDINTPIGALKGI